MKCQEFQEVVHELAVQSGRADGGEFGMTAPAPGVQRDALAHARLCPDCDALLVEATLLAFSLRSLGSSEAEAEASPRVESALVAAYRRKHARQFRGLALPKRWRPAVLAAAAALAVAAAGTYTVRQLRFAGDQPAALAQHPSGGQTAAVTSESSAPAAEMSASPNVPADSNRASAKEQRALVAAARKPATRARTNESATSLEDIDATAGKFVALPYADAGPIENAMVVRAVLPRSALGSFGLPVMDAGTERSIVADFIVAEDGTPEAIRIVR